MEQKNSADVRRLKGKALSQRMAELKVQKRKGITEPAIARALKLKSRAAVAKWKTGESWASNEFVEYRLEDYLELPRGFFTYVGNGVHYTEALKIVVAEAPSPEQEATPPVSVRTMVRAMLEPIKQFLPISEIWVIVREWLGPDEEPQSPHRKREGDEHHLAH